MVNMTRKYPPTPDPEDDGVEERLEVPQPLPQDLPPPGPAAGGLPVQFGAGLLDYQIATLNVLRNLLTAPPNGRPDGPPDGPPERPTWATSPADFNLGRQDHAGPSGSASPFGSMASPLSHMSSLHTLSTLSLDDTPGVSGNGKARETHTAPPSYTSAPTLYVAFFFL